MLIGVSAVMVGETFLMLAINASGQVFAALRRGMMMHVVGLRLMLSAPKITRMVRAAWAALLAVRATAGRLIILSVASIHLLILSLTDYSSPSVGVPSVSCSAL